MALPKSQAVCENLHSRHGEKLIVSFKADCKAASQTLGG
jgi:hypothetical protein